MCEIVVSLPEPVMEQSRVPSRPAGRDPGRDGMGFLKGIFEITRNIEKLREIVPEIFIKT